MRLQDAQRHLANAYREINEMYKAGCVDEDTKTARRETFKAVMACRRARSRFTPEADDEGKGN